MDPVTISQLFVDGQEIWLDWIPAGYPVDVQFTSTLMPADWQPVEGALNLQTNGIFLTMPTNAPQGFYRVISSE